MKHSKVFAFALIVTVVCWIAAHAEEQQQPKPQKPAEKPVEQQKQQDAKGLDMVSDTVASVFNKANALMSGNLEVTMSKDKESTEDKYERNAIGQRVPKSTAVKSAGSLHNDEPL